MKSVIVIGGSSFRNIAGNATTVVKVGAGVLRSIVINKLVATGVITVYDNTSAAGTLIATITSPAVLLQSQNGFVYNASFSKGLTVVTSAADDITIMFD